MAASTISSEPLNCAVTIVVIGAGQRGKAYGKYALDHPDECQVVAVAEPVQRRREHYARMYSLPTASVYTDWHEVAQKPRLADAALVCTLDQMHAECVCALAALGYHILCEKPMATTADECARIAKAVVDADVAFAVGHVLRYSPYNIALKQCIDSGAIGDVINIVHVEPVGRWHFAHSYVRGNWAREDQSTFSLMAKSCHDLDLLCHLMGGARRPTRVHSFGALTHFRRSQKPAAAGSALRCGDCAFESQCPYSAPALYLNPDVLAAKCWPSTVLCDGEWDVERIHENLRSGPYGRCVYECDNDVADHQVVNIEFGDAVGGIATASFTMVAFTDALCERRTRVHGSRGEIVGDMRTFDVTDFVTGVKKTVTPAAVVDSGHGGGDDGLMRAFVRAIATGDRSLIGCSPAEALQSHMLVFAAEHARRSGSVVDVAQYQSSTLSSQAPLGSA